jgi:hypothetical protein
MKITKDLLYLKVR